MYIHLTAESSIDISLFSDLTFGINNYLKCYTFFGTLCIYEVVLINIIIIILAGKW